MKPRTIEEIEVELDQSRARGQAPRVEPEEVDSFLDAVLARTRKTAAESSRALADAARTISRSSQTGLRRVGT